ncbi:helix-turn-helix domain-containing protein [Thalassobaculum sp. OXR-137]|uniref:helix-turn-helix domain-containing protein n=1 Tax=Thalassobaculum sp. OXR-137 TaxID=3100173 RepID=UPI002AC92C74|nr:helix-turn-helix domain-containing protein [Thalassobaculum sp. OXR-137]WPZ32509.1 helix-turn-helix domain-containing protein [Thalassobaculum sp. OXR-137]
MTAKVPSLQLRAGSLPNEELFQYWRRGIEGYFDTIPLVDPRSPPVLPEVIQHHVGSFLLLSTKASQQRYLRDADWARRHDDADHVVLQTYLSGRNHVTNGGRQFEQRPGTITAVNLGYQVDAVSGAAEVVSLVLPREVLTDRLPALLSAVGPIFAPASAAHRIVGDFLASLHKALPHATMKDAPLLTDAMFGLLESLLSSDDMGSSVAREGTRAVLRRYIDAHLGDPTLGTPKLCQAFKISRPTLYRLFQGEGGVVAYIQRRRLMACFRALSLPHQMHRRIYEVALDFALENPSHLTALFRQYFGMSPSEVREAARSRLADGGSTRPSVGSPGSSDADLMHQWARELGTSRVASA